MALAGALTHLPKCRAGSRSRVTTYQPKSPLAAELTLT
ncbi:MAG: hypothetical protein JWO67_668 [Streptosporangiaceae bacterium]|nr:hypothetical protein [Streptosporangiaceae bacterium]